MPRYFFDMPNLRDDEGEELASRKEAISHACGVLGEIVGDERSCEPLTLRVRVGEVPDFEMTLTPHIKALSG